MSCPMSISHIVSIPTVSGDCASAGCSHTCQEVSGGFECQCPAAGLELDVDGLTCIGQSL